MESKFELHIGGRGLAAMDFGGTSDPYYMVYEYPSRNRIYKSEVIKENLSPDWKPHVLYVKTNSVFLLLCEELIPI
jgi:Ca2+-dependent lipid-binding protein